MPFYEAAAKARIDNIWINLSIVPVKTGLHSASGCLASGQLLDLWCELLFNSLVPDCLRGVMA